jgi:hypothetical protein
MPIAAIVVVLCGVWSVLKHLRVEQPLKGFGRPLEEFP